jgi:hypothetical protein
MLCEKLHNLYSQPNTHIINFTKWGIKLPGHVSRMKEMIIMVRRHKRKKIVGRLGVDGSIILK